jgi:hypothetical protein
MRRLEDGSRLENRSWSSCSRLIPAGSGQLNPAAWAWVRYSLIVLGETEQLLAVARCDSPASYFNRRISSILRMDNLAWAMSSSFWFRRRMPHLFGIIQRRSAYM